MWFGEICSCPWLASRNKFHQTTYQDFSQSLYNWPRLYERKRRINPVTKLPHKLNKERHSLPLRKDGRRLKRWAAVEISLSCRFIYRLQKPISWNCESNDFRVKLDRKALRIPRGGPFFAKVTFPIYTFVTFWESQTLADGRRRWSLTLTWNEREYEYDMRRSFHVEHQSYRGEQKGCKLCLATARQGQAEKLSSNKKKYLTTTNKSFF